MLIAWKPATSARKRFGQSASPSIGPKRPRQSKNCANARKYQLSVRRRRYKEEEEATKRLQEQIQQLDRRLTLYNGRGLVARQNAQVAALKLMETYYTCLSRGFDPIGAPEQAAETAKFLASAFEADVKTPDFTGLTHLMQQWELLAVYHASVVCHVDSVEIVDSCEKPQLSEEREVFVVKTHGVTTLEISRATIESVFPHILANESLAQSLLGKKYSFSYTLIAYIDESTGRVFQIESKIDLTSALMDLLRDPFVTVEIVNSTTMNKRGNLLLRGDVHEDQNVIENGFL